AACVGSSSNSAATLPTPSTRPLPDASSPTARKRSATCSLVSDSTPTRPPCNFASMPRKRLFPPPTHPHTGKRFLNKGPEPVSVLTVNGRICLFRRRYFAKDVGSLAPLDAWIDPTQASITQGVRELVCRLN